MNLYHIHLICGCEAVQFGIRSLNRKTGSSENQQKNSTGGSPYVVGILQVHTWSGPYPVRVHTRSVISNFCTAYCKDLDVRWQQNLVDQAQSFMYLNLDLNELVLAHHITPIFKASSRPRHSQCGQWTVKPIYQY